MIGLAVVAVLLMLSDLKGILRVFAGFNLRYLPIILILAPLNYVFRYIRWNYYLKLTALHPEARMNRLIFISGLSMAITPGKVGELLKCYLLREHMKAPVSATSSIVMAERLSDAVALIILASFGALAYNYGIYVLLVTFGILAAIVLFFRCDRLFRIFGALPEKRDFLHRCANFLLDFQQHAKRLFTLPSLLFAAGTGVISWGFEGLVIFLAMKAFGIEISILISIFVVSFSSLVGALSFLPGGLGAAEVSIMALLLLAGFEKDVAAATTLITRFSTLWLGVGIGIVGLYLVQKQLFKQEI
jgi:uncharacterized protein (TIRG00374 family)